MLSHALAQTLFDYRLESILLWQIETGEGDLGSLQAALHWRDIVRLDEGNLLLGISRSPVSIGLLGLRNALFGNRSICIDEG